MMHILSACVTTSWEKTASFDYEWELKCDSWLAPVEIDSVGAGLLNKFSEAGCVSLK